MPPSQIVCWPVIALTVLCLAPAVARAQSGNLAVVSGTDDEPATQAHPDTAGRWQLPRKRARDLDHDAPKPDTPDWNPLAGPTRVIDGVLRDAGIVLDVDVALYDQHASETSTGDKNLGSFAWQAIGNWRLLDHERLGRSHLHSTFLGSPGLNYDIDDQTLSGNVGSVSGLNSNIFPDPAALDELFWKQVSPKKKLILLAGRVDMSSYFDTNRVANDAYRQFFAFALENNTSIPWTVYGGLGALLRFDASEDVYVMAATGDSGSDEPFAFWKSLDKNSWYQIVEIGITQRVPTVGTGHYRFIPWHKHISGEDGWGIGLSADQELGLDRLLAFLRVGIGDKEVSPVRRFVSGGLSLARPFGRTGDRAAVGVAWSDPSPWVGMRNETLLELFYRIELTPSVALTPDLQVVLNPGAGSEDDTVVVGAVRLYIGF